MSAVDAAAGASTAQDDDTIFDEIDALLEEVRALPHFALCWARDSNQKPQSSSDGDSASEQHNRGTKRGRDADTDETDTVLSAEPKRQAHKVQYTAGPDNKQVAKSLAATLQEVNEPAILKSVQLIGGDLALQLLHEVLAIQAAGGQVVPSGQRKRTAGGVYFNLLRQHLTPAQFKQVFLHNKELFREKILRKNRRRNAKRREQQAPQKRSAVDSPPHSSAPATVLSTTLPAWMAAAQASSTGAEGPAAGSSSGLAAAAVEQPVHAQSHTRARSPATTQIDSELDAELAALDALLDAEE